ncbi:ABC transporter permease [Candidatus Woesearchaeota archaeon]|nr:ABC transporter permease [Candidatus Woesearchaeota archaeon]
MRFKKLFKLALNILLNSKLRSWLTIIGIVIGVAAIVAIVSLGQGATLNVQERLGGLGADLITITPGVEKAFGGFKGLGSGAMLAASSNPSISLKSKNLTDKDLQTVKSIEGISYVNGVVSGRVEVFYLAETSSISIQGVDAYAWKYLVNTELEAGRYLNPGDTNVIVVGSGVAKSTFKQPLALNRPVTIDGRLFKVVGILKESGGIGGEDNRIFIQIDQARYILGSAGQKTFDSISAKVSDPDSIDQIVSEIESRLLISRHVTSRNKDFTIISSKSTQEVIDSVLDTINIFLGAIAFVSLLVGAVGIANTMFTSVLEKTKEIGIMKAIGAKNYDIMMIFLLNSALVGFVGGILGIGLGYVISEMLPNLLNRLGPSVSVRTLIPTSLLVETLFLAIIIGVIAGAIPAYRASKLKPVDALRYE